MKNTDLDIFSGAHFFPRFFPLAHVQLNSLDSVGNGLRFQFQHYIFLLDLKKK